MRLRLGRFGTFVAVLAGNAIGAFSFFVAATLVAGWPVHDSILSAHGVLTANKPVALTLQQHAIIMDLLKRGALISSTDLLANITSYYSTLISVLIALFFVFGFLSYLAVQAHSRRQVEEVAETLVGVATRHYFESRAFDKELKEAIDGAVQIELGPYDTLMQEISEMKESMQLLEDRVGASAQAARPIAPEDE